jgi:hypothetical protein
MACCFIPNPSAGQQQLCVVGTLYISLDRVVTLLHFCILVRLPVTCAALSVACCAVQAATTACRVSCARLLTLHGTAWLTSTTNMYCRPYRSQRRPVRALHHLKIHQRQPHSPLRNVSKTLSFTKMLHAVTVTAPKQLQQRKHASTGTLTFQLPPSK